MSPRAALFNGGMSLRFHRVTSFSAGKNLPLSWRGKTVRLLSILGTKANQKETTLAGKRASVYGFLSLTKTENAVETQNM
jgi:hypothetical protein